MDEKISETPLSSVSNTIQRARESKRGPKNISLEKIIALRKRGMSTYEIAKLLGCTHSNVVQRLAKVDLEGLELYRDNKDVVLEHKQRELLNNLTPEKIKTMPGKDIIISAGILEDKIRNIRGESTSIVEVRSITATLNEVTDRMRKAGLLHVQDVDT